ncbi:MAG: hypothetical protein HY228_02295 [Candidatus Yonathbacteria bacterium]|nr:hypothetical protein [Candidatus Yonathbacteria bacterium]
MTFTQSLANLFSETISIFSFLFDYFFYWGPIIFGFIFWGVWIKYAQAKWRSGMKWVMLEIKVPKEINKSPVAMEIVLDSLYQSGRGEWWDWYWKGRVRDWFSLEMVSLEGHIKFFIRTTVTYKNIIEAQIYAQYPDVEIYEVPDYTRYVDYHGLGSAWEMFGAEYTLSKPDPYPIKTYIDYGLDKEGIKEEFKIDPLTSLIEHLGSIGKGEQLWIQILLKVPESRYRKEDGTKGDWKDEGKDLIAKLMKRNEKTPEGWTKLYMTTKGEQETIAAIERSMAKYGFDCGIRSIYIAKKENFDGRQAKALSGLFRPFSSGTLNGFKYLIQSIGPDFPWQHHITFEDFVLLPRIFFKKGERYAELRRKHFDAYKHRSWFYLPRKLKPFVLTTEEIATIFHFPGGVAQTPTFGRIPSRKSEAPVNLPT